MSNFNKVIFMGHLTADPVSKVVGESPLVQFTVAANRKSNRKGGTFTEEVCFLETEVWGRLSEVAIKYLKKGSQVLLEGRLKQDKWQAKDGSKRSKILLTCESVILLDPANTDKEQACFKTGMVDKNVGIEDASVEELPF